MINRMMKLLCLLAIFVLLPIWAQAGYVVDETTFNKTCRWRMTRSSTLYTHEVWYEDDKVTYVFTPIGTLPNGKCISVVQTHDDKALVAYWNGGEKMAWIDKGTYTSNTLTIYSTSGETTSIPGMAWGDESAVRYNLEGKYSEEQIQGFIEGMRQGLRGEKDESGQVVVVKQEPLTAPTITLQLSEGEALEVEMVLPGLVRSTVMLEGKETIVSTAALRWEQGEAEKGMAVIYAPNTGLASLYARDEGKGGVIKKLKAGSVVLVLGKSGKYTKVYGENTVGYVITSALKFYDPCGASVEATVKTKATLYLAAGGGRKLIDIPAEEVVAIIKQEDKWTFAEYGGFTGYLETSKMEN